MGRPFFLPELGCGSSGDISKHARYGCGHTFVCRPAFIVLFLLYYSVYFTVDKGVDGIEGMRASWNTLSSHVGELLPFALTGAGLSIVGVITVFGWIVTMPLVVLMTGYFYVRIQGYDVIR